MPQNQYLESTQSEFVHTIAIENYIHFIIIYLIAINLFAYIMMWYDKMKAIKNGNRIAESTLFFIALFFGAIGIYLGMQSPIKHKSAKPKFKIGIPIMIGINLVTGYYIFKFLN